MKTLIYGKFYHITGDIKVVYENADLIPVTLDVQHNWAIILDGKFVPLHTFDVDGVRWYFTNDYQEIEIREFIRDILPGLGFQLNEIEWFKTIPSGIHEASYHVYFKLKDALSYQTQFLIASSEKELLRNLLFYGSPEGFNLNYGGLQFKTDGNTLYIGRRVDDYYLFTHVDESLPEDISDAKECAESFAPISDRVTEVYYYRGWVFYRYMGGKRYYIEYSNTSECSNSLTGMEKRIIKALKYA
ncbi:hypothetical protein [Pedobacter sp. MC2016-24]|uniref:hypothetical protein n=1 Tax=Pedobacter sp. MC2016-24 TaxID=2780090 RepID=UPI001882D20A|nr:hypothetical protein [Pedobacter sp. MC2016-24]MBE9599870.1 hypothetical protein [Pedobacter sp. MC2016-24]